MTTKIFYAKNNQLDPDALLLSAQTLREGGLVVFPTETVYGLGGNGTDSEAAKKIYAAKGRPSDNPLILHVCSPEQAEAYAYTNDTFYELADAFMPGPLTVILPKKDSVPLSVTGGLDTVAIRFPAHPIARALIKAAGIPVAAPSANLSGKPSPTCARHVIEDLDGRVDVIIDGGDCEIGLESTIIRLDEKNATLLRPGAITADALRCVCDSVTVAPSVLKELEKDERPLSPGMKYRHYAPEAPLVLLDGHEEDIVIFLKKEMAQKRCAVLCYSEELLLLGGEHMIDIGKANDTETQARKLFTALRDADKMGVDVIYAHLPTKDGIGLALYNRMIRAAAHTIRKV